MKLKTGVITYEVPELYKVEQFWAHTDGPDPSCFSIPEISMDQMVKQYEADPEFKGEGRPAPDCFAINHSTSSLWIFPAPRKDLDAVLIYVPQPRRM